jgi:hypothetical protein
MAEQMRLQHRILAARKAITAAGFKSGKYKPKGGVLNVEVIVSVPFEDCSLPVDELKAAVLRRVRERCSPTRVEPVDRPADLRTAEGRRWKKQQVAGATT